MDSQQRTSSALTLPIAILRGICSSIADWLSQRRQSDSGESNVGRDYLLRRSTPVWARPVNDELGHSYRHQSQLVIAGKDNSSYESKLRMEAGRLELAAPYLWPDFLSGVDKAATRAEALVPRHSYMARMGRRP